MTDAHYNILEFVVNLPLYLTAFIGIGLALRLRKTHPRACWYTVAAGVLMFVHWGLFAAFQFWFDRLASLAEDMGFSIRFAILVLNTIASALGTMAAALMIAAILTGRRSEP